VSFAPVVVARPVAPPAGLGSKRERPRQAARRRGIEAASIMIEAGTILVRIGRGAEPRAVEAILRALKGSA